MSFQEFFFLMKLVDFWNFEKWNLMIFWIFLKSMNLEEFYSWKFWKCSNFLIFEKWNFMILSFFWEGKNCIFEKCSNFVVVFFHFFTIFGNFRNFEFFRIFCFFRKFEFFEIENLDISNGPISKKRWFLKTLEKIVSIFHQIFYFWEFLGNQTTVSKKKPRQKFQEKSRFQKIFKNFENTTFFIKKFWKWFIFFVQKELKELSKKRGTIITQKWPSFKRIF